MVAEMAVITGEIVRKGFRASRPTSFSVVPILPCFTVLISREQVKEMFIRGFGENMEVLGNSYAGYK